MAPKAKRAITVLYEEHIIIECPFCGRTLIKTNYQRIRKLLDDGGIPRGKACEKCGGVAVLKLTTDVKEKIRARLSEMEVPSGEEPTVPLQGRDA
jgi:uncharacterized Zn finger protein